MNQHKTNESFENAYGEIKSNQVDESPTKEWNMQAYASMTMLVWFLLCFFGRLILSKGIICCIFAVKASMLFIASCFHFIEHYAISGGLHKEQIGIVLLKQNI